MPAKKRTNKRKLREKKTADQRSKRFASNPEPNYNYQETLRRAAAFERHLKTAKLLNCRSCNESWFDITMNSPDKCKRCANYDKSKKFNKFSAENNMDPGPVPEIFAELSPVEEMLIARVHPVICVFRRKGGQYFYKNHVINFRQNVTEFASKLPHTLSSLSKVFIVRRTSSTTEYQRDFVVSKSRVYRCLAWLKQNNKFYSDIQIDETRLAELPDSETNALQYLETAEDGSEQEIISPPTNENRQSREYLIEEVQSEFVREQNIVDEVNRDTIQDLENVVAANHPNREAEVIPWPEIESSPVNEYKTPGYVACAFVSLFPSGRADFLDDRQVKVTHHEYFKHLFRYKDGRFRSHNRFGYFALNTTLRWKSNRNARVFINKQKVGSMTPAQLIHKIRTDKAFQRNLRTFSSNERITDAYWRVRRYELFDMIEQLGPPTFFITLSAADQFWPDLLNFFEPDRDLLAITEWEHIKRTIRLLNSHAAEAAYLYNRRIRYFLKNIVFPVLKVKDHWYRVEFQERGSPHIHAMVWCEGAPDASVLLCKEINESNEQQFQELADYFDSKIDCWYPEQPDETGDAETNSDEENNQINQPEANPTDAERQPNPCIKYYSQIERQDHLADYKNLINQCQLHKCNSYCSGNAKKICRFGYPKNCSAESQFVYDPKREAFFFQPRRNHPFMNPCSRLFLEIFRANMDIQAVSTPADMLYYLATYASKSESKSKSFLNEVNSIANLPDLSSKEIITKLVMNSFAARSVSKQETSWFNSGQSLYSVSRKFKVINLSLDVDQWIAVDLNSKQTGQQLDDHPETDGEDSELEEQLYLDEEMNEVPNVVPADFDRVQTTSFFKNASKDVVEYLNRPGDLRNVTLKTFFSSYKLNKTKSRSAKYVEADPPLILRVFPIAKDDEEKAKINVLLNVSFTKNDVLLQPNESWQEALGRFNLSSATTGIHQAADRLEAIPRPANDSDEESEPPIFEEWNKLSAVGHNQQVPDFDLGRRTFDTDARWHENTVTADQLKSMKQFAKNQLQPAEQEEAQETAPVNFNEDQQHIIDHFNQQVDCFAQNQPFDIAKLTLIEGVAGAGKSTVLKYMISRCKQMFGENSSVTLAPTGLSALNVHGETIQSRLKIYLGSSKTADLPSLTNAPLQELQQSLKDLKFVFIDEMSMVGVGMLHHINERLKAGTQSEELFGGCCVYLIGDFNQLPPIGEPALYKDTESISSLAGRGRRLFKEFKRYFTLMRSMRQAGEDQEEFRGLLNRVGNGQATMNDKDSLNSRFIGELANRAEFDEALHLFAQNKDVDQHNNSKLKAFNLPILLIKAKDQGSKEKLSDLKHHHQKELRLCVGCKVMLRKNLKTNAGLVNGSVGIVREIFYSENAVESDQPAVIMVEFDGYHGPTFSNNCVPIFPITLFSKGAKRHQFPLTVAYAITIHKSQGLTLAKLVLSLEKANAVGLAYVGLSRVTRFEDLALKLKIS